MTRYPGYAEDLQVGKPAYTMPTSRADFEEVFPLLVQDLTNHATQYGLPETALVWFRNVRSDFPSYAASMAQFTLQKFAADLNCSNRTSITIPSAAN
jgi:hypothetical protein